MTAERPDWRPGAVLRLVHPFPSILDGAVVAGAAAAAGDPIAGVRLGASMVLLQFAIGAVNDVRDAPRDAGRTPPKPVAAGLVTPRVALAVAGMSASGGLVLALPSGAVTVVLAVLVLGIGLLYDLGLKATAWSWLPFALGIPILPVYGWAGTGAALPPAVLVALPVAMVVGAALAIANALGDLERDAAAGVDSVATSLGAQTGGWVTVVLFGGVAAVATGTALGFAMPPAAVAGVGGTSLGLVTVAVAAARRGRSPLVRRRAWAAEAVLAGMLGIAWLLGAASAGLG